MDAYNAPFVFKHRYWIGILLFTRIIHHFLSSILDESIHPLIVCSLMCVLLILKLLNGEVYKNWLISFLETSFIFNLLLFSVSAYYINITKNDQVALANVSVLIAFITFTGIALYHIHTHFLRNLNCYSKLTMVVKQYSILNLRDQDKNEVAIELNSSALRSNLLREPLLENIAPHTTQNYPPSDFPLTASAAPRPVTTTVVCINDALRSTSED